MDYTGTAERNAKADSDAIVMKALNSISYCIDKINEIFFQK